MSVRTECWNNFCPPHRFVFVDYGDGWRAERDLERFRPIRTPEQIAAEEREERLIAMSHAYQDFTGESPNDSAKQAFRALDLAGYRKQVAP